jgi:hypothetical protein
MATKKTAEPGKEEQIGYHKGALTTLAKERQEMMRILGIVEQLMQVHIGELQKLGVDLTKETQAPAENKENKPKKPIEDIL